MNLWIIQKTNEWSLIWLNTKSVVLKSPEEIFAFSIHLIFMKYISELDYDAEADLCLQKMCVCNDLWLGISDGIFWSRFCLNLVGINLGQIPPTIPNFSWIAADFFLVQNFGTRCLCNLLSVCGTRVIFFVRFTNPVFVVTF